VKSLHHSLATVANIPHQDKRPVNNYNGIVTIAAVNDTSVTTASTANEKHHEKKETHHRRRNNHHHSNNTTNSTPRQHHLDTMDPHKNNIRIGNKMKQLAKPPSKFRWVCYILLTLDVVTYEDYINTQSQLIAHHKVTHRGKQ
jgi:hypothetical protein